MSGRSLLVVCSAAVILCASCGPLVTTPTFDPATQMAVEAAVSEVSADRLLQTLQAIDMVRSPLSPDLPTAQAALVGLLESWGYAVERITSGGEGTYYDPMDTLDGEARHPAQPGAGLRDGPLGHDKRRSRDG